VQGVETVSDTIARIIEREPDWQAMPRGTPHITQRLLRRCLQKDSERRQHDIADTRIEIDESLDEPSVDDVGSRKRVAAKTLAALLVGSLVAAIATWVLRPVPPTPEVARFSVVLPEPSGLWLGERPHIAIAPDGTRLVYVGESDRTTQLYVRALDQLEATPIPGARASRSNPLTDNAVLSSS
jgi:hypothetical protein